MELLRQKALCTVLTKCSKVVLAPFTAVAPHDQMRVHACVDCVGKLFPSFVLVLQELIDVFHANLVESAGKIHIFKNILYILALTQSLKEMANISARCTNA